MILIFNVDGNCYAVVFSFVVVDPTTLGSCYHSFFQAVAESIFVVVCCCCFVVVVCCRFNPHVAAVPWPLPSGDVTLRRAITCEYLPPVNWWRHIGAPGRIIISRHSLCWANCSRPQSRLSSVAPCLALSPAHPGKFSHHPAVLFRISERWRRELIYLTMLKHRFRS